MFKDYQANINVDLCFQSFEQELASLPGRYEVVLVADQGCVALRQFAEGVIELKRLFVYPQARGSGLGRALTIEAIRIAKQSGYRRMRLDTIAEKMPSAVALYQALGFCPVSLEGGIETPKLLVMELAL